MGTLLSVIGIILIAMSLLLLIVTPLGIVGIAAGVGAFLYGRRYKKQKKAEQKKTEEYVKQFTDELERTQEFHVAGYDYYQNELKELLGTPNEDYTLTDKTFVENIDSKTYEYDTEWYDAELMDEPENEFDSGAIAVYVHGVKIGYVARKDQKAVRDIEAENIEVEIYGGRYKDIEWDDDWHIIKGETPYKARLYIRSR